LKSAGGEAGVPSTRGFRVLGWEAGVPSTRGFRVLGWEAGLRAEPPAEVQASFCRAFARKRCGAQRLE
jgi:hypothetical protein